MWRVYGSMSSQPTVGRKRQAGKLEEKLSKMRFLS